MHTITKLTLVASAAALMAACGAQDEGVVQQPDANPVSTVPTPADEASAPVFVEMMAANDMYELEAARIAQSRSQNADVTAFAAMMAQDHSKSTADLRTAISAGGLTTALPTAMPENKAEMIQALNDASAEDFDNVYMGQQVDAHQSALNLLQRYANDGDNESLRNLALAVAPVVQAHLDRAREIREALD